MNTENRPHIYDGKMFRHYIQFAKRRPSDYLLRLVQPLNLDQYGSDDDEKAIAFTRSMYKRNLKWSTFQKYFRALKPLFWPKASIKPSPHVFDVRNPPQNRTPDIKEIATIIKYIKDHDYNKKSFPILMAYYTGLRVAELVRLQISHLSMLKRRERTLPLQRKSTNEWGVFYFVQFGEFLNDITANYYADELKSYELYHIDGPMFEHSISTINYRLKLYYLKALGKSPYPGFGIHVFRYHLATVLKNKDLVQRILDHKNIHTTAKFYIKANQNRLRNDLTVAASNDDFYKKLATTTNAPKS